MLPSILTKQFDVCPTSSWALQRWASRRRYFTRSRRAASWRGARVHRKPRGPESGCERRTSSLQCVFGRRHLNSTLQLRANCACLLWEHKAQQTCAGNSWVQPVNVRHVSPVTASLCVNEVISRNILCRGEGSTKMHVCLLNLCIKAAVLKFASISPSLFKNLIAAYFTCSSLNVLKSNAVTFPAKSKWTAHIINILFIINHYFK